MASSLGSLDNWRKFFRTAGSDIFDVIENAIVVAAFDCPQEFRNRRDRIVEKFYTAGLPRCSGCERASDEIPMGGAGSEVEDGDRSVKRETAEKESKVDSCNDGSEELNRVVVSNYSYDEAEALTEEMEEENQTLGEVLRIKDVLANKRDASDNELFDSLRRLQLMELTVDVLKATEIGRVVNGLRKSNSKPIRHLVRTLIEGWKVLVDEWVSTTAAIAGNTPNSENPTSDDYDENEEEEGLPFPPLDEIALFATQTSNIQLSEFFDGMDDDGNLRNNGDLDKKRENGRRPPDNHEPMRKHQPVQQTRSLENKGDVRRLESSQMATREDVRGQDRQLSVEEKGSMRRQEPITRQVKPQDQLSSGQAKTQVMSKQSMPVIANAGPGRPLKLNSMQKNAGTMRAKPQQSVPTVQRKPPTVPQEKPKSEEATRLEIAKRKLHEGYQQAENAKKQRTIQVMELQDIPKQPHHNRPPMMKSRNNNFKSWANGRH